MSTIDRLIKLCENDMELLGAMQELAQYRNNPIAKMEPCWKYVRENDIDQQIEHIKKECIEAEQETDMDKKALEVWDILQGCITAMAILEQKCGIDIAELVEIGIKKNTDRLGGSYYKLDGGKMSDVIERIENGELIVEVLTKTVYNGHHDHESEKMSAELLRLAKIGQSAEQTINKLMQKIDSQKETNLAIVKKLETAEDELGILKTVFGNVEVAELLKKTELLQHKLAISNNLVDEYQKNIIPGFRETTGKAELELKESCNREQVLRDVLQEILKSEKLTPCGRLETLVEKALKQDGGDND